MSFVSRIRRAAGKRARPGLLRRGPVGRAYHPLLFCLLVSGGKRRRQDSLRPKALMLEGTAALRYALIRKSSFLSFISSISARNQTGVVPLPDQFTVRCFFD